MNGSILFKAKHGDRDLALDNISLHKTSKIALSPSSKDPCLLETQV